MYLYHPHYNNPWWTEECERLAKQRRKAKNIFCKRPTEQNLRELRIAENKSKEANKVAKKKSWEEYASSINSSTSSSEVWNKIKKFKCNFKPKITTLD